MAPRFAIAAFLLSITLSGCATSAGFQDWQYKHVNKKRASQAWRDCHSHEQRKCLSCDYEDGFKAGFFDTATGKDCKLPPVPPPKYWSVKYQCCEGQKHVQDWFRGYQCGIVAAEGKGFPNFSDVPTSPQAPVVNRTACGTCYSPDACNCEPAPPVNMMISPSASPGIGHHADSANAELGSLSEGNLHGPIDLAFASGGDDTQSSVQAASAKAPGHQGNFR